MRKKSNYIYLGRLIIPEMLGWGSYKKYESTHICIRFVFSVLP